MQQGGVKLLIAVIAILVVMWNSLSWRVAIHAA
jgi:hypothetical protein